MRLNIVFNAFNLIPSLKGGSNHDEMFLRIVPYENRAPLIKLVLPLGINSLRAKVTISPVVVIEVISHVSTVVIATGTAITIEGLRD